MPLVVVEDRSAPMAADAQNNGRFGFMRMALREVGSPSSSRYSRTTNAQQMPQPSVIEGAPKIPPMRPLFGEVAPTGETPYQRPAPNFATPLDTRPGFDDYSPATQPSEWGRAPAQPSPAAQSTFRHPADEVPIINYEEHDVEAAMPPSYTKRRRHHRRRNAWTRKRKVDAGSRTCAALLQGRTRSKAIATIVSGAFLVTILGLYLSIALVVKNLRQEIHILFILSILGLIIFFAHSLIRLVMLTLRRGRPRERRPAIPSIAGPEGFKPDVPIPVQLARDDELLFEEDGSIPDEKLEALKQPPPAYGLWRGSVRIDPNLLHWQKNNAARNDAAERETRETGEPSRSRSPSGERRPSPNASPDLGSIREAASPTESPRRPPSYISEDDVSYVVSALPPRPPSEIHPALRIRLP